MHSVALSDTGDVYTWGVNDTACLGREVRAVREPLPLPQAPLAAAGLALGRAELTALLATRSNPPEQVPVDPDSPGNNMTGYFPGKVSLPAGARVVQARGPASPPALRSCGLPAPVASNISSVVPPAAWADLGRRWAHSGADGRWACLRVGPFHRHERPFRRATNLAARSLMRPWCPITCANLCRVTLRACPVLLPQRSRRQSKRGGARWRSILRRQPTRSAQGAARARASLLLRESQGRKKAL